MREKLIRVALSHGPLVGMYGFFSFLAVGFLGYRYGIADLLGAKFFVANVESERPQPIQYNHFLHVADPKGPKLDCKQCHQYTDKGPEAGAPPLFPLGKWIQEKDRLGENYRGPVACAMCHDPAKIAEERNPEVRKLLTYMKEKKPVVWTRVHRLPDHVYFNHKRHIKGLELRGITDTKTQCAFCHGEVQMMGVNRQVRSLEMGMCVSCHKAKDAPLDCWTCHK